MGWCPGNENEIINRVERVEHVGGVSPRMDRIVLHDLHVLHG